MEQRLACSRRSDSGVRREARERKKILWKKGRGREEARSHSLVDFFFLLTSLFAVPHDLASVVQRLDSAINLHAVDSAIIFPNTYPLDSDLSGG